MNSFSRLFLAACAASAAVWPGSAGAEKLSVLIIDGQNNHAWQATTPVLRAILEGTGRFTVEVSTSPPAAPRPPRMPEDKDPAKMEAWKAAYQQWEADKAAHDRENRARWEAWQPEFAAHDAVMSNYNGELWPEPARKALEEYVAGGGGFVAVHAANNSHPEWRAYNEMIGLGGWGGRSELSGPYLRLREGKWVPDASPGRGGSHGARHEFVVETQAPEHPVMRGLPARWMQAEDELYDRLRGPARQVTVLAAAFSDEETRGSGEHEPLLLAIDHGKGRVFHTALGHDVVAMGSVGFQETLARGTEWAATGEVTFPPVAGEEMPEDKPGLRAVETAAAP